MDNRIIETLKTGDEKAIAKSIEELRILFLRETRLKKEKRSFLKKIIQPIDEYTGRKKEINEIFASAFQQFASKIQSGLHPQFQTSKLKSNFFRLFDKGLIELLNHEDPLKRQVAENYFEFWFRRIFRNFKKRGILRNNSDLEEAYNRSLIYFFNKLRNKEKPFRREATLQTYFHTLLKYRCIDIWQAKSDVKKIIPFDALREEQKSKFSTEAWSNIQTALDELSDEKLKEAWERLKKQHPKCHKILKGIIFDGYSHREIAEILHTTANSIKAMVWKCKGKLKELYNNTNIKQ